MTTFEHDILTDGPARRTDVSHLVAAVRSLLDTLPDRPSRLRLSLGDAAVDVTWSDTPTVAAPVTPDAATTSAPSSAPAPTTHDVVAPCVGTFYRAPEPGAAPFVADGDVVQPGQQVGIIEAMKLMMPVAADRAGRVRGALDDGVAVEYGAVLVTLVPLDD
jgi:acetyl-CoA carboxylase biotin carboxyl carrier protein